MTEASHNAARWWTKNKLRQEDISRKPLANNDDLQLQADVLKLNVTQLDVKSGFQRDIASASRDPQKSLAYGDFESLDGEIELREEHFDRNNELNNLKKETSADYFQQNPNNFVHNRRRVNSDSMIGRMDLRKDSTLSEDIAMIEVLPARKIWKESLAQAESLDATDRSVGLENFKKKPSFLVPHTSCHNQVLTLKITTSKKWWLQWKGNNRFFCDGRIMVGVHVRQLVCSTLLLVSTWVVFLLFVSLDFVGYWCPAVGIVLVIVSVCTLAHCAMSDPGIIPPRPRNSVVDTMPAAVRIQLNYCMTCHIVRPQRTKHCRHCNTCVRRFDHHCPWVGNCIGQRNYRSFLIFITVVSISSIFVSVLSILYTLDSFGRINNLSLLKQGGRYGNQYVSIALSIWSSLVALLVTGLLALHFYLFHKGMTTNEFLKGTQTPDERGFWSRCWGIWFGIIPDSLLPPMHMYPSNDDVAVNQGHASASLDTLLKEHSQFSDSIV